MAEQLPEWMDAEEPKKEAPADTQEALMKYVAEATDLKAQISEAEDELECKKERLSMILRDLIPTLMDQLGTTEFKFPNKTKIVVNGKVNASINKANEKAAFDWLVANGYGGLIKSNITAEFEREEIDAARELEKQLQENGVDAVLKESVHVATLKSFVAERLEAGETLPDSIGVFEFREAKITLPKGKK